MARRGMLLSFVAAVGVVLASSANCVVADTVPQAVPSAAQHPLLVIEQHRASVVQRIVGDWGHALTVPSTRALTPQNLSEVLWALRADRLQVTEDRR
jgi:hypothetical protein